VVAWFIISTLFIIVSSISVIIFLFLV
jgi:hypothetical protein